MPTERYCYSCGKHVKCREEAHTVAGSTHSRRTLFCPDCGKELGAVYDQELEIKRTFPAPRG